MRLGPPHGNDATTSPHPVARFRRPVWSICGAERTPAAATHRKPRRRENSSATCDPLLTVVDQPRPPLHGKEGVDGSSPLEGLETTCESRFPGRSDPNQTLAEILPAAPSAPYPRCTLVLVSCGAVTVATLTCASGSRAVAAASHTTYSIRRAGSYAPITSCTGNSLMSG